MTVEDLIRKHPGRHIGYTPRTVGVTTLEPMDCGFLLRLCRVPAKIAAHFQRDKIAAVWKTVYGGLDDTYYILRATDGTLFRIEY